MCNYIPQEETTWFELCRRYRKLNIDLRNCVFRWFVLYNYKLSGQYLNVKTDDEYIILKYSKLVIPEEKWEKIKRPMWVWYETKL